mgnify:CR=1 FL=1|jgi:septal ring factor EnvC (AmiA/AmiB activator)
MTPTYSLAALKGILGAGLIALSLTGWGFFMSTSKKLDQAQAALSLQAASIRLLEDKVASLEASLSSSQKAYRASQARVQTLQADLARRKTQDIKAAQDRSLACFSQAYETIHEALK